MSEDDRRDDDRDASDGRSEAKIRMEQEMLKRKNKADEEWKEYEEMRRSEKEKEKEDIRELRERRELRKKEREEEEKRLSELRQVEDQKRRAEEEERQRKKREDEQRKKEERERRKKEAEERSKAINRPNYIINKRIAGAELLPLDESKSKEEVAKSKEQLEAERKAILEQRIQPLNIQGLNADQLKEKAKDLHQTLYRLESEKYDLEQRFQRQNYDMMELAERARQMNKGGGKGGQKMIQAAPDPLSAKISGIPPKVAMYSEYERVKDHRTFGERQTVFTGPMYSDEYQRINPTHAIVMTEQGAKVVDGADGQHSDAHGSAAPAVEGEAE